jgi:cell division protease FtsH
MDKKIHLNIWYFLFALLAIVFVRDWWAESQQVETIPYSQFQNLLASNQIEKIAIADRYVRGTLRTPLPDGQRQIFTLRVDPDFAKDLAKYDVSYTAIVENKFFSNLLSWMLPVLFFFGIWYFVMRRFATQQGLSGMMSVGKSKAKVYVETDTKVTFDDVAGVDEAKEELREIVEFLKDPTTYGRLGARIPKGILLVGPPGTGKTLFARAVAGEAGVPFFSISGSEFVEMFVGLGAARVRDLFEQARKSAPCIIFIDELDALGRARGAGPMGGGADEKEQTLNQLLSELDGFDSSSGVVLLSATNRPEILDPALLRAGRFDRQVLVDRPDRAGRVAILNVHMRKIEIDDAVDREQIAALTPGFTGADLANLVNEAAILATRRAGSTVTMDDFTGAIERIVAGLEKKSRVINPMERRVIAYHELGHAFVAICLSDSERVHKVSIIPRGVGALGYTIQRPTEDRYLMSRSELENKIAVLLGGRAAESLFFDEISTGAADDLSKATDIARNMATRYGMDETLGQATYAEEMPLFLLPQQFPTSSGTSFSEETKQGIDRAVRNLIAAGFGRARDILEQHREKLEAAAVRLLEKETLQEEDLKAIARDLGRPSEDPAAPETARATG